MARVDYSDIIDAVKSQIESSSETPSNVIVGVEEDQKLTFDSKPTVMLFYESRSAPENEQRLAKGRYIINFTLDMWAFGFHFESKKKASQDALDLASKVEYALMEDPTLGNKVSHGWPLGGDMIREHGQGFVVACGIRWQYEVKGFVT